MQNKTYTTFDIAKMLDVYPKTVGNWVDDGKLKAFVTPGGHRRVSADDLVSFLKEYNMPVHLELISSARKRILIVDDEEAVMRMIVRTISRKNNQYEIETATDGFQAGRLFSDFKPHLIVLDIKLPGIDGIQVCKKIRESDKNVKIIAITGYDVEENRKKMLAAGADDFMAKPLDMNALIKKTETLLEKS